jgi:hypothetical protein
MGNIFISPHRVETGSGASYTADTGSTIFRAKAAGT